MPDIPQEAVQAAVDAVNAKGWRGVDRPFAAHFNHKYDGACSVCRGDVEAIVSVAIPAFVAALAGQGMVVVSAEDLDVVMNQGDQRAGWARYSEACDRLRAALPERCGDG